ncbi:MAG: type IV pilin protein [Pseudomonadales bacterium]|jgi:type IV pilus assembly protein PilE|tara:strand:- start:3285 stop:3680 length:396 start_codon:yes stop_codon:yes gene_type:complete
MKQTGFSLIELMVVLAIIGIITVIAYPSYQSYTCDTFKAQAVADLRVCALSLDRYYSDDFTYLGAVINDGSDAGNPSICLNRSPSDGNAKFTLTLPTATLNNYIIIATPVNADSCGSTMQLTADGSFSESI